jgi:hypothetical protein
MLMLASKRVLVMRMAGMAAQAVLPRQHGITAAMILPTMEVTWLPF